MLSEHANVQTEVEAEEMSGEADVETEVDEETAEIEVIEETEIETETEIRIAAEGEGSTDVAHDPRRDAGIQTVTAGLLLHPNADLIHTFLDVVCGDQSEEGPGPGLHRFLYPPDPLSRGPLRDVETALCPGLALPFVVIGPGLSKNP